MAGKAELDVPAIDTSSHCSSAISLHHIRGCGGRPSRGFRLRSLLPSSLIYNRLFLYLTVQWVVPWLPLLHCSATVPLAGLPWASNGRVAVPALGSGRACPTAIIAFRPSRRSTARPQHKV